MFNLGFVKIPRQKPNFKVERNIFHSNVCKNYAKIAYFYTLNLHRFCLPKVYVLHT